MGYTARSFGCGWCLASMVKKHLGVQIAAVAQNKKRALHDCTIMALAPQNSTVDTQLYIIRLQIYFWIWRNKSSRWGAEESLVVASQTLLRSWTMRACWSSSSRGQLSVCLYLTDSRTLSQGISEQLPSTVINFLVNSVSVLSTGNRETCEDLCPCPCMSSRTVWKHTSSNCAKPKDRRRPTCGSKRLA